MEGPMREEDGKGNRKEIKNTIKSKRKGRKENTIKKKKRN
jgi:hypothetical protein